jgi:hypothetical protein
MAKKRLDAGTAKLLRAASRPSDPEDDPFDRIRPGQPDRPDTLEEIVEAENAALHKGFRDRMKNENDRWRRATDSEHWVALCFVDREHREAFCAYLGIDPDGEEGKYMDGHKVVQKLGIELRP